MLNRCTELRCVDLSYTGVEGNLSVFRGLVRLQRLELVGLGDFTGSLVVSSTVDAARAWTPCPLDQTFDEIRRSSPHHAISLSLSLSLDLVPGTVVHVRAQRAQGHQFKPLHEDHREW